MTKEHQYEEWFEKYFGDVESPYSSDLENSPFVNTPKPFRVNLMIGICSGFAGAVVVLSCLLSYIFTHDGCWFTNWASNALLNLSIGIVASIILMFYSNLRERNIAFYSDIIPGLEMKYNKMHKGYFQYIFKFPRYYSDGDFERCFDAWHYCSNASFAIIGFLSYLNTILPFRPNCFGFTEQDLKSASDRILEANQNIQKEFYNTSKVSKETFDKCEMALCATDNALLVISALIIELKQNLYGIKYGSQNKKAIKILNEQ